MVFCVNGFESQISYLRTKYFTKGLFLLFGFWNGLGWTVLGTTLAGAR